ncbi:MAG: hypothetical protein AB8F65_08655 [Woeseiaceae bacterium]
MIKSKRRIFGLAVTIVSAVVLLLPKQNLSHGEQKNLVADALKPLLTEPSPENSYKKQSIMNQEELELSQTELSSFLANGQLPLLLLQSVDFLPILYELEALMKNNVEGSFYATATLLRQCRDVRRLMSQPAPAFIASNNITDTAEINFYYLREKQCRGLFNENLWVDRYMFDSYLLEQSVKRGYPPALIDSAVKEYKRSEDRTAARQRFVDGVRSGDPVATAMAGTFGAGTVIGLDDSLALLLIACDQTDDCLRSTGILRDICDTELACIPQEGFRANARIHLGGYAIEKADKRANEILNSINNEIDSREIFDWIDDDE